MPAKRQRMHPPSFGLSAFHVLGPAPTLPEGRGTAAYFDPSELVDQYDEEEDNMLVVDQDGSVP